MSISTSNASLFELDRELDLLLDEIQEQAEEVGEANVSPDLVSRFQDFCDAFNKKVDRIGHFLLTLDARASHCRNEASRLADRARIAENKAVRTKTMVLYYLESRGLKKIEGLETSLRRQKNSQDSVTVKDDQLVPLAYREIEARVPGTFWERLHASISEDDRRELDACVRQSHPSVAAIKAAKLMNEDIPGTEVRRGHHLRVE